jgi:hypothetical protein
MAESHESFLLPNDLHARLAFPQTAVVNRIRESIDRGVELLNAPAEGPVAFNSFRANRSKWDDHNRELLRRLFKIEVPRQGYERAGPVPPGASSPKLELERLRASVEDKVAFLQTLLDHLDRHSVSAAVGATETPGGGSGARAPVLVVHGTDTALARTVGRFLDAQRLIPVIVGDTPGEGEIRLDQIDAYSDARFAVVLIPGDSVGGGGGARAAHPDALLKLGYFAGRMGAARVCGLIQPGVPDPGRLLRVKTIEFDEAGTWRAQLASRLKSAGFEVRNHA